MFRHSFECSFMDLVKCWKREFHWKTKRSLSFEQFANLLRNAEAQLTEIAESAIY